MPAVEAQASVAVKTVSSFVRLRTARQHVQAEECLRQMGVAMWRWLGGPVGCFSLYVIVWNACMPKMLISTHCITGNTDPERSQPYVALTLTVLVPSPAGSDPCAALMVDSVTPLSGHTWNQRRLVGERVACSCV
jgi:hypothetical protein